MESKRLSLKRALARLRWHRAKAAEPNVVAHEPETTAASVQLVEPSVEELIALTQNWDGYARERAIRKLAELNASAAIPAIILRANDWVPEVRHAANAALWSFCKAGHATAFVQALPDLLHLNQCYRADHRGIIEHVTKHLASEENQPYLLAGWESDNLKVARACALLIIKHELQPTHTLVERGLAHSDLMIRLRSAELISKLPENDQPQAIALAATDQFSPIRKLALRWHIKNATTPAGIANFLLDRQVSIRQLAIRHFQRNGVTPAPRYIEALSSSRNSEIIAALWAVAELGLQAQRNDVRHYLGNAHTTKVRRQALRSLAKLGADDLISVLVAALADASVSYCKVALRLMDKYEIELPCDQLLALLGNAPYSHSTAAYLRLSEQGNKWNQLVFILRAPAALQMDSETTNHWHSERLDRWQSITKRSFVSPSAKQVETLRPMLTESVLAKSNELTFLARIHGLA